MSSKLHVFEVCLLLDQAWPLKGSKGRRCCDAWVIFWCSRMTKHISKHSRWSWRIEGRKMREKNGKDGILRFASILCNYGPSRRMVNQKVRRHWCILHRRHHWAWAEQQRAHPADAWRAKGAIGCCWCKVESHFVLGVRWKWLNLTAYSIIKC